MSPGEVASVRDKLWDSGFRPVPLRNWDDPNLDEHLRGKKPLSANWPELAREDPPNCLNYPPVEWALNSGMLCDGMRNFDYDIDDGVLAARCVDLTRARLGDTLRRCRQNSSRCLLLYLAANGEPGKLTIAGPCGKIEVLGRGQQVVVHGIHASGVPLVWTPWAPWEIRREGLPTVTEDEVLAVLTDLMPLIGAERISGHRQDGNGQNRASGDPQADPLRIAAALNDIPNTGAPDWSWWNNIGMAVWRATGGSELGFEAFDVWSQRNPSYSAKETRARWDHYPSSPPDQVGAGSIFHLAAEARRKPATPQVKSGAYPRPEASAEQQSEPPKWYDEIPVHPGLPDQSPRVLPLRNVSRSYALAALRNARARVAAGNSPLRDEAQALMRFVWLGFLTSREIVEAMALAAVAVGMNEAEFLAALPERDAS
jgi:hypothetical protein